MSEEIRFQPGIIRDKLDGRPVKWLSDRCGIRLTRLYNIVNGTYEPTASELITLARALNMKPEELMTGAVLAAAVA